MEMATCDARACAVDASVAVGREIADVHAPPVGQNSALCSSGQQLEDAQYREAVRRSWGSYGTPYCIFVGTRPDGSFGWDLWWEMRKHRDVVLLDRLVDSYENLTLKTLMAFAWIEHNVEAEFILKADTDVYVHAPRLEQFLKDVPPGKFYMGRKTSKQKKLKVRPSHKWYLSDAEYPFARFPPYMMGSGYIVSSDLTATLAACVPPDPGCVKDGSFADCDTSECCAFQPLRFEDVTAGGIVYNSLTGSKVLNPDCAEKACLQLRKKMIALYYKDNNRFINEPYKYPKACTEQFLTMHRVTPAEMEEYYSAEKAGRPTPLCPSEEKVREMKRKKASSVAKRL
eukprot:CAMPEP_0198731560 /NCGR_PEP_ID=MMETSP1475-20131203/30650_1 /TAXON_ID= ORGANISM="Unidentified sp., Strain CCMP1999" /NCGR_SAMPLE_ID=MMETSP1475 /ASSEMBLY_ACC=CAM_ASM_001111 /LENGTH=341 /DNA_ID=CAMNT_0044494537 /DNA_START=113 /DNA_END=1139 /DNA_ORIENTATION=-